MVIYIKYYIFLRRKHTFLNQEEPLEIFNTHHLTTIKMLDLNYWIWESAWSWSPVCLSTQLSHDKWAISNIVTHHAWIVSSHRVEYQLYGWWDGKSVSLTSHNYLIWQEEQAMPKLSTQQDIHFLPEMPESVVWNLINLIEDSHIK